MKINVLVHGCGDWEVRITGLATGKDLLTASSYGGRQRDGKEKAGTMNLSFYKKPLLRQ
jgi:hypothetical protein